MPNFGTMHKSIRWDLRRCATLLGVVGLHGALIATLLSEPRTGLLAPAPTGAVEIKLLPPAVIPRIRAEAAPAARINGVVMSAIPPPALDSSWASTPPASSADGVGAGIDWAAEARLSLIHI